MAVEPVPWPIDWATALLLNHQLLTDPPGSGRPAPVLHRPRHPMMERSQTKHSPARTERQLAHLKIISRLLGHELHVQTSNRITLSRDEVIEVQTSIDLFIEEIASTRKGTAPMGVGEVEVQAVAGRG